MYTNPSLWVSVVTAAHLRCGKNVAGIVHCHKPCTSIDAEPRGLRFRSPKDSCHVLVQNRLTTRHMQLEESSARYPVRRTRFRRVAGIVSEKRVLIVQNQPAMLGTANFAGQYSAVSSHAGAMMYRAGSASSRRLIVWRTIESKRITSAISSQFQQRERVSR